MKRAFFFALGAFAVVVLAATYGGGGNGPYFNNVLSFLNFTTNTVNTGNGTITIDMSKGLDFKISSH